MSGLLWRDAQLAPSKEHPALSILRLSWATVILLFVWLVEVVMVLWAWQGAGSAHSETFVLSSFFLLFWTVASVFASLYAFGRLKAPKTEGTALSTNAVYLATGSQALELEFDDIKSMMLSPLPAGRVEGLARFTLTIKTERGASIELPLVDRAGFLAVAEHLDGLSQKLSRADLARKTGSPKAVVSTAALATSSAPSESI